MTFVIDTVGQITLPTGETCQGVILTSDDPADIREASRHWAGRVTLSPVPERVDDSASAADQEAAR